MIEYRKVHSHWVETTLKLQEMRTRARRRRFERVIEQGARASVKLKALQASCTHDVISQSEGPTYTVTTCAICGKTDIH